MKKLYHFFGEASLYTFTYLKVRADRRKKVMVMVAQAPRGLIRLNAKAGSTAKFVRLPMSLIGPWAWAPTKPKKDTINVQSLMRGPGGGLLLGPKYYRGPATSKARWRCRADLADISA